jgi:hypothetical protein
MEQKRYCTEFLWSWMMNKHRRTNSNIPKNACRSFWYQFHVNMHCTGTYGHWFLHPVTCWPMHYVSPQWPPLETNPYSSVYRYHLSNGTSSSVLSTIHSPLFSLSMSFHYNYFHRRAQRLLTVIFVRVVAVFIMARSLSSLQIPMQNVAFFGSPPTGTVCTPDTTSEHNKLC